MDSQASEIVDIGRFVRARRMAFVAPDGEEDRARRRHVPYLTQGELAKRVGVSGVVISQIEQGRYRNLNASILKRIARALGFSVQQEAYALGLLTPASSPPQTPVPAPVWLLESIAEREQPTFLLNPAYEVVGWNSQAEAMFGQFAEEFLATGNALVSVFSMPEMKTFFVDWDEYARSLVSGLRMSYSVHPELRGYISSLANKMSAEYEFFHKLWTLDDPLVVPTIEKELAHPALGPLRVIQIITLVLEAPKFTTAEYVAADDETAAKWQR